VAAYPATLFHSFHRRGLFKSGSRRSLSIISSQSHRLDQHCAFSSLVGAFASLWFLPLPVQGEDARHDALSRFQMIGCPARGPLFQDAQLVGFLQYPPGTHPVPDHDHASLQHLDAQDTWTPFTEMTRPPMGDGAHGQDLLLVGSPGILPDWWQRSSSPFFFPGETCLWPCV